MCVHSSKLVHVHLKDYLDECEEMPCREFRAFNLITIQDQYYLHSPVCVCSTYMYIEVHAHIAK